MATQVLTRETDQGGGTSVRQIYTATPPALPTTQNIGTPGTGVTVVEYGDQYNHITDFTFACTSTLVGAAALGWGNLIYTLPAGACAVTGAYQAPTITAVDGNIDADTPDAGMGTVIASGVVSVLGGTATFENIITGQTATNCTGTATGATFGGEPTAGTGLEILVGAAHTIHLNWADTWAGAEAATAIVGGTARLFWTFYG